MRYKIRKSDFSAQHPSNHSPHMQRIMTIDNIFVLGWETMLTRSSHHTWAIPLPLLYIYVSNTLHEVFQQIRRHGNIAESLRNMCDFPGRASTTSQKNENIAWPAMTHILNDPLFIFLSNYKYF